MLLLWRGQMHRCCRYDGRAMDAIVMLAGEWMLPLWWQGNGCCRYDGRAMDAAVMMAGQWMLPLWWAGQWILLLQWQGNGCCWLWWQGNGCRYDGRGMLLLQALQSWHLKQNGHPSHCWLKKATASVPLFRYGPATSVNKLFISNLSAHNCM